MMRLLRFQAVTERGSSGFANAAMGELVAFADASARPAAR